MIPFRGHLANLVKSRLCVDSIPPFGLDFETVWSSIFDLGSLAVYRADGDPRTAPFVADNRLRAIVKGI